MMESELLQRWLGNQIGGTVSDWKRIVAGNSRTTWSADVEVPGGPDVRAIVRVDSGNGPFSDTVLTLEREATIYRALQGTGACLPRLLGFDPELRALAIERVSGTPAWDDDVADALLHELACLHRVDVDPLELPGLHRSAAAELDLWAGIHDRRVSPRSPFVDLALLVLRETFPGEPERLVLVHGDPGIGNVLWDGERITALLDWEMAHLGDPHDDLAFLSVRTAMHGLALPDFHRRVRQRYAGAAGVALDGQRLRYWQAVAVLRNLVTCLASISNPVRGRDRLVHHMLIPSLNRLLVSTLAPLVGVSIAATPVPEGPATLPGSTMLRDVAGGLSELVDAVADEERRQSVKRMRFLLDQFAETWPVAFAVAAAEAEDGPPATALDDRLRQLARVADRELALFPRAVGLARSELADFDGTEEPAAA